MDEHGFLQPSSQFFGFERLLDRRCTLIVAPPWIGKTFTAKRIQDYLRPSRAERHFAGPDHHHLTNLEAFSPGQPLQPNWWDRWILGKQTAIWIVDALEEGQRRDHGICPTILDLLSRLSVKVRRRLCLLLFARDAELRELVPEFEADLARLLGEDFTVAELLPLDLDNARDLVYSIESDEGAFDRVLSLIERNSLEGIAAYPAALEYLAKQPNRASLSFGDVWKGVLRHLLLERRAYRPSLFQTELEARFDAAARIAVVLTLTGQDEVTAGIARDLPSLSEIIPASTPDYLLATRKSAREALRSLQFWATPEGHRFLHKNVREWMAAFGLSELPLEKLRPILQEEPASLEASALIRTEFGDLASMLASVHSSPQVREWIDGAAAPFPSDLFSQDIGDVCIILDRLEEFAARGGRLREIENREALRLLAVSGLGNELAKRLLDKDRNPEARRVLLEIGGLLDLDEVLSAAATIVTDPAQNELLRSLCAFNIKRSGRVDLLTSLETFVEKAEPTTRVEKETVSILISAYLEQGYWDAAQAFRFMPRGHSDRVIDHTRMLPGILERALDLRQAEKIVLSLSTSEIKDWNYAIEQQHRRGGGSVDSRWKVYAAAIKKLVLAGLLESERRRTLVAFAVTLGSYTELSEPDLISDLEVGFRASKIGRRELFTAATGKRRNRWLYGLLCTDDLEWLERRLVLFAKSEPSIWHLALRLSEQSRAKEVERRIRQTVEMHAPAALSAYKQAREQHNEWEREAQQRKRKDQQKMRKIEEINRELLSSSILSPQERLWQLSWVNFSEKSSRPVNVVGSWSDVEPDLQHQVLDVCTALIESIEPTPVPDGSSYPATLRYEAQAFVALLQFVSERFGLTHERIEKWLPAVLRTFHPVENALLEDCLRLAPGSTETVLLAAIDREFRDQDAYSVLLQNLPTSLWTENVTQWAVKGVESDLPIEARPRVLGFLAARRPETGLKVARNVLDSRTVEEGLHIDSEGLINDDPDKLWAQALNVVLVLAPDEAWPRLEEGVLKASEFLMEKLDSLTSHARDGLKACWWEWPRERAARLAELLFAIYPPENDPPDESGFVTPVDDLRQLRWRLIKHLLQSDEPEVIERVKTIHPVARSMVVGFLASRDADALVDNLTASSRRRISVSDACRLLDDKHFRLIRTGDDLLDVLIEELRGLEKDLGYDYVLLYRKSEDGKKLKRRHEKVLQAYVLRRLADRLPGKVLDSETHVKRGRD